VAATLAGVEVDLVLFVEACGWIASIAALSRLATPGELAVSRRNGSPFSLMCIWGSLCPEFRRPGCNPRCSSASRSAMISLTKLIGFSRSWSAKSSTMLAIKREDIKAEIERLEKALRDCSDSGIRRVIEEWIADAKRRLVSGQESK
jgi:hypothetical protein